MLFTKSKNVYCDLLWNSDSYTEIYICLIDVITIYSSGMTRPCSSSTPKKSWKPKTFGFLKIRVDLGFFRFLSQPVDQGKPGLDVDYDHDGHCMHDSIKPTLFQEKIMKYWNK